MMRKKFVAEKDYTTYLLVRRKINKSRPVILKGMKSIILRFIILKYTFMRFQVFEEH